MPKDNNSPQSSDSLKAVKESETINKSKESDKEPRKMTKEEKLMFPIALLFLIPYSFFTFRFITNLVEVHFVLRLGLFFLFIFSVILLMLFFSLLTEKKTSLSEKLKNLLNDGKMLFIPFSLLHLLF